MKQNISKLGLTEAKVTPCVGVWIETVLLYLSISVRLSHPAWVCGLKHPFCEVEKLS